MRVNILSTVKTHDPVASLYFSEVTYRYSLLRRMEDEGSAMTEADGDSGPRTVGEESDEVST